MSEKHIKRWIKWGLLNLAIVALYGMLMRYKIAFNFPFFEQKNLLHAHSHFAFSGWITHMLYSGIAYMAGKELPEPANNKYNRLIILNLVCSIGMLVAFTIQGYKAVSIFFSTASIFVAIVFVFRFINDFKKKYFKNNWCTWAAVGLILNVLSSAGPFYLAYMMASKNIDHHLYLGAIYYYLHFQYNGWFFFGAMALVVAQVPAVTGSIKKYLRLLTITVIPTFFLSVLWMKLPLWLYVITVVATITQLVVWGFMLFFFYHFFRQSYLGKHPRWVNVFFYGASIAITIKFLLQTISVIPSLSQLVFGIRPIVIAYLHLVLLGAMSLFLIGFVFATGWVTPIKFARNAAFIFLTGVILNELLLTVQGFAAFAYTPVPFINEMLLGAALILFSGSALLAMQKPYIGNKLRRVNMQRTG